MTATKKDETQEEGFIKRHLLPAIVFGAGDAVDKLRENLKHEDGHIANESARILLEVEHRERHSQEVK